MKHKNAEGKYIWYVYDYETGKVCMASYNEEEARRALDDGCVLAKIDLKTAEDEEAEVDVVDEDIFEDEDPFAGQYQAQVSDILNMLPRETDNMETTKLDDGPTPGEEEDACKAYGLKKPE